MAVQDTLDKICEGRFATDGIQICIPLQQLRILKAEIDGFRQGCKRFGFFPAHGKDRRQDIVILRLAGKAGGHFPHGLLRFMEPPFVQLPKDMAKCLGHGG